MFFVGMAGGSDYRVGIFYVELEDIFMSRASNCISTHSFIDLCGVLGRATCRASASVKCQVMICSGGLQSSRCYRSGQTEHITDWFGCLELQTTS